MISPNNIKKSQAKHIIRLLEKITRAEVIARLGKFDNLGYIDYAIIKIELEKELLKYVFGTSDLVILGERWKILERSGKVKYGKSKKSKKTLA